MGDQVSKQVSFLNLLKTSFCGKLEMLSEKLDNVWLIISRHTSQFFSITKVAAQDAPSLWLGFDKLCQVCVWRGAHLTCNLGRISKYKFLAEFYSKYQFRASVYNVVWYVWEWWESPNSHSHVRWSQMKWKHRSHSTPHKLWNYSKYFNYWVRMDPIWNAVDFVGKFNTGFTYLGINYDFIQTNQLSHRINSDLDPISR